MEAKTYHDQTLNVLFESMSISIKFNKWLNQPNRASYLNIEVEKAESSSESFIVKEFMKSKLWTECKSLLNITNSDLRNLILL